MGFGAQNLLSNALRVLVAALERVAARWVILKRLDILKFLEVALEKMSEFGGIQLREETDSAESPVLTPYLARVEYSL